MINDPVVADHFDQGCRPCIVAEGEDANFVRRQSGRQEFLWPRLCSAFCCPSLVRTTKQAVDEDNAVNRGVELNMSKLHGPYVMPS